MRSRMLIEDWKSRMAQISLIKDSANPVLTQRTHVPSIVILAKPKGPSVLVKHSDRQGGDVNTSMNLEIGKQRVSPKKSTQGEETQNMSTSASAFTLELVRKSLAPPYISTTATTIGLRLVSIEFL